MLTSSGAADIIDGRSITFSGEGSHTVTATLGSVTTTASITVIAGPLSSLSIAPSSHTLTQGDTLEFTVTGTDSGGNPVDASAAVLSSTGASDTVSGRSVTFSGAGSRFVSATLSGVTTSAVVEVVAGALASLTLTPNAASAVQGDTIAFTLSGEDAAGNPIVVDAAILASSAATDTVDGRLVTFSGAGSRTVTASLDGVTATASVDVVAGPAVSLTITPLATSVAQGGSVEFVVGGEDAAGNPVDARSAVLTSSVPSDVVNGLSVTFPHASPHTITATIGGVSASVTIEVIPAAVPVGLAATGADGGAAALLGGGALALLVAGGILLLLRRAARQ